MTELKRRSNNHRSKHKDKRSQEDHRVIKQKSPREKKTSKYGVSTLLEDDPSIDAED